MGIRAGCRSINEVSFARATPNINSSAKAPIGKRCRCFSVFSSGDNCSSISIAWLARELFPSLFALAELLLFPSLFALAEPLLFPSLFTLAEPLLVTSFFAEFASAEPLLVTSLFAEFTSAEPLLVTSLLAEFALAEPLLAAGLGKHIVGSTGTESGAADGDVVSVASLASASRVAKAAAAAAAAATRSKFLAGSASNSEGCLLPLAPKAWSPADCFCPMPTGTPAQLPTAAPVASGKIICLIFAGG